MCQRGKRRHHLRVLSFSVDDEQVGKCVETGIPALLIILAFSQVLLHLLLSLTLSLTYPRCVPETFMTFYSSVASASPRNRILESIYTLGEILFCKDF